MTAKPGMSQPVFSLFSKHLFHLSLAHLLSSYLSCLVCIVDITSSMCRVLLCPTHMYTCILMCTCEAWNTNKATNHQTVTPSVAINSTGYHALPVDLLIGGQWTIGFALGTNTYDCVSVICDAGKEDKYSANFPWLNNYFKYTES